jgi:Tfp pilus assembly protein PilN
MLLFFLIGLSLVLLGIAGLQFTYMFYVERMHAERLKHMQALEQRSQHLTEQLKGARKQIAEQNEVLKELRKNEEVWADVLEDR